MVGADLVSFWDIALAAWAALLFESVSVALAALVIYLSYRYLKNRPKGLITSVGIAALSVVVSLSPLVPPLVQRLLGHSTTFKLAANTGWQNTQFRVSKPDTWVHIEVTGRISLAINQQYHLAEFSKYLIQKGSNQPPERAPDLNQQNRYDRSWIGAEGDMSSSDMFDNIRMVPEREWGIALCAAHPDPQPDIDEGDPWSETGGVRQADIVPIPQEKGNYQFTKAGFLVCMVNDAVISDKSPYEESRKYFKDLNQSGVLQLDLNHHFRKRDIPHLLLNDNAGEFTLKITDIIPKEDNALKK